MEQEMLAKQLIKDIDLICGEFHYYKKDNVIQKAGALAPRLQQFCNRLLEDAQGLAEEDRWGMEALVTEVLKDYIEAVGQQDLVLMLDTLDYGLRELLNIYIDEAGEVQHG